ncbi:MAG: YicC family protein [Victivallales bacterium]|nr:YicC family protein [Victivallales bacterium]
MKSMTGFGRGTAQGNGVSVTVEISAVNSKKQLDLHCAVPRELGLVEPEIRAVVQKRASRGTLNLSVNYQIDSGVAGYPVNEDAARVAATRLQALAAETGLAAPTLADVLSVPGVLEVTKSPVEAVKPLLFQALEVALSELDAMRVREGKALHDDLAARGETMSRMVEAIAAQEEEAQKVTLAKLQERIAQLGVELPLDDERLAKELAFYVDKADITEETVRLRSHLVQYRGILEMENDAGRNLDFLCQEMSREANTLAAKTADLSISGEALALKIELSKVKEQILNVE